MTSKSDRSSDSSPEQLGFEISTGEIRVPAEVSPERAAALGHALAELDAQAEARRLEDEADAAWLAGTWRAPIPESAPDPIEEIQEDVTHAPTSREQKQTARIEEALAGLSLKGKFKTREDVLHWFDTHHRAMLSLYAAQGNALAAQICDDPLRYVSDNLPMQGLQAWGARTHEALGDEPDARGRQFTDS